MRRSFLAAAIMVVIAAQTAAAAAEEEARGYRCGPPRVLKGVVYGDVELVAKPSAVAGINRRDAPSYSMRPCQLANFVAAHAATISHDVRNFAISGGTYEGALAPIHIGHYHCIFSPTDHHIARDVPAEWGICTHRGRDPNTVDFLVEELDQRV